MGKEFEARLLISEEQYFFIVTYYMNLFPNQKFLQNTNVYYDTDDLYLRSQHITLRLRTINDVKSELTMKIKGEQGDEEINDGLSPKEAELLSSHGVFPYGQVYINGEYATAGVSDTKIEEGAVYSLKVEK